MDVTWMRMEAIMYMMYTVRDITWIGAIKYALHQVEVGTCTNDTWSLD